MSKLIQRTINLLEKVDHQVDTKLNPQITKIAGNIKNHTEKTKSWITQNKRKLKNPLHSSRKRHEIFVTIFQEGNTIHVKPKN